MTTLLEPGTSLVIGTITDLTGPYYLAFQFDQNLVIYKKSNPYNAVWATNTASSGAVIATMQDDGNFVLYNAAGQSNWSTATQGNDKAFLADLGGGILSVMLGDESKWAS